MTVHDDLATLRAAEWIATSSYEASRRVEAEIARLEELNESLKRVGSRAAREAEAAEADNARLRDGLRQIEQTAAGEADDALVRFVQRLLADQGRRRSRKEELVAGMVALADDLEAGRIFLQDFPADLRKRLRRALLADQDGAATCAKCRHAAHAGGCGVNVGTGYHGPVPCRCGADQDGAA